MIYRAGTGAGGRNEVRDADFAGFAATRFPLSMESRYDASAQAELEPLE